MSLLIVSNRAIGSGNCNIVRCDQPPRKREEREGTPFHPTPFFLSLSPIQVFMFVNSAVFIAWNKFSALYFLSLGFTPSQVLYHHCYVIPPPSHCVNIAAIRIHVMCMLPPSRLKS